MLCTVPGARLSATTTAVICGGDVALAGSLNALQLDRVATAPGHKLLVLGNHDFTRRGKVAQTGFEETWMTLLVATDRNEGSASSIGRCSGGLAPELADGHGAHVRGLPGQGEPGRHPVRPADAGYDQVRGGCRERVECALLAHRQPL